MQDVRYIVVVLLVGITSALAQPGPPTAISLSLTGDNDALETIVGEETLDSERLKIFLDCDDCDDRYIRQEMTYVNYVRDRKQADVHVLVTRQRTAGGGAHYTFHFIGQDNFTNLNYKLKYDSPTTATDDERRQGFLKTLAAGLMPFISQTPYHADLDLLYKIPDEYDERPAAIKKEDPWNSWVFEIVGGGDGEAEKSRNEYDYEVGLEAERITEAWKIRAGFESDFETENIRKNGKVITSPFHRHSARGLIVKSLGERFAVGIAGEVYTSTSQNIGLGLRLTPAIEYNLFPYRISERKLLTLTYRIGPRRMTYREETIFGKFRENLGEQSLKIALDIRQPWGSVSTSLEGSHYFHDFRLNHLELENELKIRLFEGLSLWFKADIEAIHDQLNIPRREATLEEILLKRRELLTNYVVEGAIGLSYEFGSIFSNVVNPRL